MKKRIITTMTAIAVSASVVLSACSSSQSPSQSTMESQKKETGNEEIITTENTGLDYEPEMDKNSIMSIQITADPEEWQNMIDNASDKEYISADITINGTTIENVGIRAKGNSSLTSVVKDDETDRYSFKIKFDAFVEGQTWKGLDKLNLNNNYSDATSMKEYLSYDIMSYIGVEAPLYAYSDISINGETWGFYLAVEDMDSSYRDRALNGEGELYKPDSMDMAGNGEMPKGFGQDTDSQEPPSDRQAGEGTMPERGQKPGGFGGPGGMNGADDAVALIYTDDEISSYSSIFDNDKTKTDEEDHKRVIESIKNLNEGTDLETYVDVDATLRYLAAHTAVVNLDSYSGSFGHNYILYENNGQLTMLPWDYNMAFGGFQSSNASDVVNFPIDTPVSGVSMAERPMISKLLEVTEYKERYHQYLQEIIQGYFADGEFEKRVDEVNNMISEYIKNDPSGFYSYEEYQTAVEELKKLGALRGESVQGQLDGSIPSTSEGQSEEPDKLIDASSVNLSVMGGGAGSGERKDGQGRGLERGGTPPEIPDGTEGETSGE